MRGEVLGEELGEGILGWKRFEEVGEGVGRGKGGE